MYTIIDLYNNNEVLMTTDLLSDARRAQIAYGEDTVEIHDDAGNNIIVKGIDARRV